MKRVMFIGKSAAGKTTLCQYLNREALEYHKTQSIQVIGDGLIDTPGEYLEQRSLYRALIVTSAEAEMILLVQDATDPDTMFAPQFASMFTKPVTGVVTKSDGAGDEEVRRAKEILTAAGAGEIFVTSSITGAGCEALYTYLDN